MDYYAFNAVEALWWIALGIWAMRALRARGHPRLAIYALTVLMAFGASDVAEIAYGSFLDIAWLFLWKMLNVAAIIYGIGWYISLRNKVEI